MNLTAIRIKCAEIVGWKFVENPVTRIGGYWETGTPGRVGYKRGDWGSKELGIDLPDYPESADAALELVEWMSKPENGGWTVVIDNNTRYWTVFIHSCGRKNHSDFSNTFPLAVCLAFLRANNIDPETL